MWVGNEAGILNDLHPSVIRFHITRENEVQVKEILNAAKSIQKGERASLATEYTTGHLKREVYKPYDRHYYYDSKISDHHYVSDLYTVMLYSISSKE